LNQVRDGNGVLLRSNDNWKDQQRTDIAATTIAPTERLRLWQVVDFNQTNPARAFTGNDSSVKTGR
jgi:hypothetical protein